MLPSTDCLTLPPIAKYTPMQIPAASAKRFPDSFPPESVERSEHIIKMPPPSATRIAKMDFHEILFL